MAGPREKDRRQGSMKGGKWNKEVEEWGGKANSKKGKIGEK